MDVHSLIYVGIIPLIVETNYTLVLQSDPSNIERYRKILNLSAKFF